jgi:polyhydroxybutyrate depolymerase
MKRTVGIVFAAAALAFPAATTAGATGGVVMHWTVDGVQRDAIVFAPPTTSAAVRRPLIFAFHGHGGRMQRAAAQMHFETIWPQAIVVYPQGLNSPTPRDPAATQPGWQFRSGDSGNRDLRLFDAMVADLKKRYNVDPRRIYTTGFSNGAIFSYLLWADRAKMIAAVGAVAGRLDPAETLTAPRALIAIGGTRDTTLPFPLQLATIELAKEENGASGTGAPCGRGCTFFASGGGDKTPVKTLVHTGAHVYPSWAPTQIGMFFRAHPQPCAAGPKSYWCSCRNDPVTDLDRGVSKPLRSTASWPLLPPNLPQSHSSPL